MSTRLAFSTADRAEIVVMVSHSLGVLRRLYTRTVWIDAGHIRADGAPDEVLASYESEVARSLEARPPEPAPCSAS